MNQFDQTTSENPSQPDLKEIRQNLEAILNAIDHSAIVSVANLNGEIIRVNDEFCNSSGYSRQELLGKNHRILNSGHHPRHFWEEMWKTVLSGKKWRAEVKNRAKDGSFYWVETFINPILNTQKQITSFFSIRYLITDKKIQEEELREREYQLHEATGIANVGRWELDLINNHLHWSDGIYTMFEIDRERFAASYEGFLNTIHPDDRDRVNDAYRQSLITKKPYDIQHRLIMPDGRVKWVMERCRTEYNPSGEAIRSIGIVQDITDLKHVEEELRKARLEAEKSNNAKSEFLSNMSHELRTPLNAILGFAQLLEMNQENNLSKTEVDYVQEIIHAGDHLLELINDVLELSRIESGKMDLAFENVDLHSIIDEVKKIGTPLATRAKISLQIEPPAPRRKIVYADRIRLKQVLLNLVSNAIKYNRPGGFVLIHTEVLKKENQNQESLSYVRVSVQDNGKGISKQQMSELFIPFSRLDQTNTSIEGTGIGLVITKRMIEMMNGSISVSSEPEQGSTFSIDIPFVDFVDQNLDSGEKPREESFWDPGKKNITILYVEDNQANTRLLAHFFEKYNHVNFLQTNSGKRALDLAFSNHIDLFVLDINIPELDGFQVLEQLRKSDTYRDVPVFALSASAMKTDIEKGKRAGFHEYLTKPINLNDLHRALSIHLNQTTENDE